MLTTLRSGSRVAARRVPQGQPPRQHPPTLVVVSGLRSLSSVPIGGVPGTVLPHDAYERTALEKRRRSISQQESIYKLGKHRSNALELVSQIPIIEVDGDVAVCDGGGGALGHPLEYISLERPGSVEACKYCQLRFTKKVKK